MRYIWFCTDIDEFDIWCFYFSLLQNFQYHYCALFKLVWYDTSMAFHYTLPVRWSNYYSCESIGCRSRSFRDLLSNKWTLPRKHIRMMRISNWISMKQTANFLDTSVKASQHLWLPDNIQAMQDKTIYMIRSQNKIHQTRIQQTRICKNKIHRFRILQIRIRQNWSIENRIIEKVECCFVQFSDLNNDLRRKCEYSVKNNYFIFVKKQCTQKYCRPLLWGFAILMIFTQIKPGLLKIDFW